MAAVNIPPISMGIVLKSLLKLSRNCEKKTFMRSKFKYTISKLKPSEAFLNFIANVFRLFCRKLEQDRILALFYGEIIKDWKVYFPPCDNQKAINVLLNPAPANVGCL